MARLWEEASPSQGWPEFRLEEASWIEGGKVWILELQPADSPPSGDLEETHETRNAEIVELKESREMGVPAIQEYQHESDEITSLIPGHMPAKETFIGNGEAFSQSLKLTTRPRPQCEKLLHCDQCWKAFRYPSHLAQHQRVHSRQKAKHTHSPSKAGSPNSMKPTPRALQVENKFTNSRKVLSQNANVTTNQSSHRRRRCFCDQCGKAFRCPSELARHQPVHTRQKAAKRSQSQSQVESPSLLESTVGPLQMENTFTKPSRAFHQKSKAMRGQNTHLRKQHFCDQCGKVFPYPSHLAQHQRVHSRQKAKRTHSPSKAGSPSSLKPTQRALQVESTSTNPRNVLSQNSNVTTNQSSHRRRRCFCNQCGKAFRYPSELARHQPVHTRRKTAKWSQSQSQVESSSLLESTVGPLQMENTFTKPSRAFHQKSKAMRSQNTRLRKQHFCDQCGKAFPYPSQLAQHQRVHSRQKAKRTHSPSKAGSPSSLKPTPRAPQVESTSTNPRNVLSQNSNVTTNQSSHRRRRCFCNQCGKAFRYPSELARHQPVHTRRKTAKRSQSQSQVESSSLLESTVGPLQMENTFTKPSRAFHQKSKAMRSQNTRLRKQHFCDQCGKVFPYPSQLAQHQRVHSRQKAKRTHSPSKAGSPSSLKPTPRALQVESTSTNPRNVLSQNSNVTTNQSSHRRRRCFCNQCGKAFRCPSELARHQPVHTRRKAAKRSQSQSQVESSSLLESTVGPLQMENTFTKPSRAFHQKSKAMRSQNTRLRKQHFCDQCGKVFPYPSQLAQHQRVHSRQKAKRTHSPSKAGSPSSLKPTPRALQVESTSTNPRNVLSQNSNVTTNKSSHRRRRCFCNQCGKAFRYPSELARHQPVHTRQKAAKWSQSQVESPSLLESTVWPLQMQNTFTTSSVHQKSKAMRGQNTRLRKQHFCDQCGKAFPYPSHLAQHQRVHSRQKAKRTHSPSKAGSPSSLKPTPRALQVESTSTNPRNVLSQNSNVTTNQNSHRRRQCFCDQCGKAFRCPSELAGHHPVHMRQKEAEQSQSQSRVESPSLLESTVGPLQMENTFTKSSRAFHQKSKAIRSQNTRLRKQHFCDQCGKVFPYPSHLARHQGVHSRQKAAKWAQSPSEADNHSPLDLTSLITLLGNISLNSSNVLSQNSKVMANQSSRRRKRRFCDQCGESFHYLSVLDRHQHVHSEEKAAKQSQSQSKAGSPSSSQTRAKKSKATTEPSAYRRRRLFSEQCGKAFRFPSGLARHQDVHSRQKWILSQSEADSPTSLEPTPVEPQVESLFSNSSKELHRDSKVTADQSSRCSKRRFCDQCGESLHYPSVLARHQHVHSEEKAAKQSQSQSEAGSPSSTPTLAKKSKATTEPSAPRRRQFFCEQCGKAFRYRSDLARHQDVHSRQKWILSQSEADSPTSLEPTPVEPQVESPFSNSSKELHQDSKVMADQSSRCSKRRFCDQCGESFHYPSVLARHQHVNSEQKTAKQSQSQSEAGSPSSTPTLAKKSKVTTEPSAPRRRQFFCEQCGKAFRYPSDLARHQDVHSRQKWILSQSEADSPTSLEPTPVEPQVESPFSNSSKELHRDLRVTTDQSSRCSKRHFCDQCGKDFRYPSGLARHQDVHSRQKWILSQSEADSPTSLEPTPVEPEVESPFSNSSKELHRDLRVTTDQSSRCSKRHFCDQCGKAFRYPSDIARHQRVHLRREAAVPLPKVLQRENALANLSEAVSPSSTRMTDRNTHTKKPYLCDWCGEGFSWCSELTQHEYTHFQERPYDCGFCGRQFRRHVQLVKHQKWHEDRQEGEEEGKTFQNMDLDNGIGEYMLRELLQDLPPKRTGELCEPFVGPETCKRGACEAGANDTPELLPVNSIWEIGISGQPYLMPLPPACEFGCSETEGEGGGSASPTEPALLQGEVTSSTTLVSAVSSCELLTTMPTVPAASPGAHGHMANVPKETTSTASTAVDHVARPPQTVSPDPEWLPSLNHPRQPQKLARSSVQGAKSYSCLICSKRFRVASYLKRHLNIHRLGKPYSCIFCGKKFGRSAYLAKHYQRIHSEVPKGKTSTASTATDHVARPPRTISPDPEWLPSLDRPRQPQKLARSSVQGAKPHTCPICSKRFKVAEYLRKHLNIHRLGKPYSCIFCGKRFGRDSYLAKHYRRLHRKAGSHLPTTQQLLVSTL